MRLRCCRQPSFALCSLISRIVKIAWCLWATYRWFWTHFRLLNRLRYFCDCWCDCLSLVENWICLSFDKIFSGENGHFILSTIQRDWDWNWFPLYTWLHPFVRYVILWYSVRLLGFEICWRPHIIMGFVERLIRSWDALEVGFVWLPCLGNCCCSSPWINSNNRSRTGPSLSLFSFRL